jgi:hypothetical protein
VTLRLTKHWHNKSPQQVIADAELGGMHKTDSLIQYGIFSITYVKQQTTYLCKKELGVDARSGRLPTSEMTECICRM